MSKSVIILLIIISFFTLTSFNGDKTDKWKLEKDNNGIKVYSFTPEGESLKHVKTYFTVKSTLSAVLAVLLDVPRYTNWIYNCTEAKLLKKINDKEMLYYSVSDVPWPLSNRDLVMKNKVYQNKKTKILYSISIPQLNLIPFKTNKVRIVNMYGRWKVKPLKDGYLAIEYYIKLDPGGIIPDWVTNLTIQIGPYQTMLKFKETLKLEKYKNAQFDFIEE